ncbi:MAG: prepilin-type N-terminal cleavage/methylation domain-containing protein [Candidatus Omnitrophica bacterium]|nr:prepilin-type N-terminal cleavage/methylation domain-containing protein [Candidatus Omnitrophota bacterium]
MRKGFTLVEIMIVVAIIALLAAIAIPNLLRARTTANESAAQATLRTISTALETYAAASNGQYPSAESALLAPAANPPFLNKSYCTQTENGYTYGCALNTPGYTLTARPVNCTTAGTKSFTMSTGGVLVTDATCTAAGG